MAPPPEASTPVTEYSSLGLTRGAYPVQPFGTLAQEKIPAFVCFTVALLAPLTVAGVWQPYKSPGNATENRPQDGPYTF